MNKKQEPFLKLYRFQKICGGRCIVFKKKRDIFVRRMSHKMILGNCTYTTEKEKEPTDPTKSTNRSESLMGRVALLSF